ncbi:MAG: hypothetical protein ACI8PT_001028 [Gammaproteobacteria bacterium]|jgi:hypothetical protein
MDDIVLKAMTKWPRVPAVYGWLALDRRGRWRLRGERIGNTATNQFISRNYAADDCGRFFFQNGPQRVFVDLEYAPWVLSLDGCSRLETHTGAPVETIERSFVDDEFNFLIESEHGLGLLHDQDLAPISEGFEDAEGSPVDDAVVETALVQLQSGRAMPLWLRWHGQRVPVLPIKRSETALAFHFDPNPRAEDGSQTPVT